MSATRRVHAVEYNANGQLISVVSVIIDNFSHYKREIGYICLFITSYRIYVY